MGKKKRLNAQRSNRSLPKSTDISDAPANASMDIGEILLWLCLALFAFLIYSNTLESPFIFDDSHVIQDNPNIRLTNLTFKEITRAGFDGPSSHRPVVKISFALNYYFHGYKVLGYHLVNMMIHITTGILLYLFAKMTLGVLSRRSGIACPKWIPFFTALLWLVHPIQTQSVTYMVQRMNSMAAMFYLLSMLLYGKARLIKDIKKKWILYIGCIVSGVFSLGSKENSATLPFFLFLYEWYFFQDLDLTWLKRRILPFTGILLVVVSIVFGYLGADPITKILADYKTYPFTLTERVLTEFRVIVYYISLMIGPLPSRLNLDYDFTISHSLSDPPTTLGSLVLIAGLIGLSFYTAKKMRLLSFTILWFLGNLLIESSVIGLDLVFEHRNYLPSMLVSLTAVTLIYQHLKPKWLGVGILCAVSILFSVWTYERNGVWHDDMTLWADCAKKSPKKARPQTNLGVALYQRGKIREAMNRYSEALRLDSNYIDAHNNLGIVLRRQGRLEEAMDHFSAVLRNDPDYREAHNNLANTLSSLGRLDEAIAHYTEAIRIDPQDAIAHYNLANTFGKQGKYMEARTNYETALRIRPDFPEARRNLQRTLQLIGRTIDETKTLMRQ
jgi:protein O-mannosyl-transferase